jgi:hypothetical protein
MADAYFLQPMTGCTTILKFACSNLTKLSLYQGRNNALWEDDLEGELGMTDEERYDEIVEKIMDSLPNFQEPQLANFSFAEPEEGEDTTLP